MAEIYTYKDAAPDLGAIEFIAAVNFARPSSDIVINGWRTNAGGSTSLFATIDESTVSDADYVKSSASPVAADRYETKLGSVSPGSGSNYTVSYRIGKDASGGDQINLTVSLVQGTTVIATWTHTNISSVLTTYQQTLTAPQIAAITNFADLRLRFDAIKV